jgi:hypothetical protein
MAATARNATARNNEAYRLEAREAVGKDGMELRLLRLKPTRVGLGPEWVPDGSIFIPTNTLAAVADPTVLVEFLKKRLDAGATLAEAAGALPGVDSVDQEEFIVDSIFMNLKKEVANGNSK